MSYILDALRRADAERDRGAVPGLHAQPAALGELDVEAPRRSRTLLVAIVVAVVLLILAVAWWILGGGEAPRGPSAAGSVAPLAAEPAPSAPAPVITATPVAAPPVAMPATLPPVASAVPALPRPAPPVAHAIVRNPAPRPAASAPARAAPASAGARQAAASEAAPQVTAAADPRVYQLSELPDEIRRELPTLAIGGAMYSPNPANRMLIVNGQAFHEGDKLAPNLALEQIRLKSALLEYKGYRYRISY